MSYPTNSSTYSTRNSSSRGNTKPNNILHYIPLKPVNKDRIAYFYDEDVSTIHYGKRHPMKPQRMAMANELILHYGLFERLVYYQPRWATEEELKQFHVSEYIDFLRQVSPDNLNAFKDQLQRFNVGDDCPIFNDLYKFCRISAGASIQAARRINSCDSDIAINWSGGLHHAKKVEASGFCYVNDIVLGIMELLRYHQRVVYIDIDVHHGDGVQEAFYKTDRVMTVSFHRYGPTNEGHDFFPGTGALDEIGFGRGKYYSINVPLKAGMDDATYVNLFKDVINKVIEMYRPGAIVLQCGADSLGCDRLGCFCLSIRGHGQCVDHIKQFNIPMLVLGGGGYTVHNVARCWAYETALLCNADLPNRIPPHPYLDRYGPDYTLFPKIQDQLKNENSLEELEFMKQSIYEQLRYIQHAPSVQLQSIPPSLDVTTEEGYLEQRDMLLERQADLEAQFRLNRFMVPAHRGEGYVNGFHESDYYEDEMDQDLDDHDPDQEGEDEDNEQQQQQQQQQQLKRGKGSPTKNASTLDNQNEYLGSDDEDEKDEEDLPYDFHASSLKDSIESSTRKKRRKRRKRKPLAEVVSELFGHDRSPSDRMTSTLSTQFTSTTLHTLGNTKSHFSPSSSHPHSHSSSSQKTSSLKVSSSSNSTGTTFSSIHSTDSTSKEDVTIV